MMPWISSLMMVLVCVMGSSITLADSSAEETRLLALLDEFMAGASENDAAIHDRFWADDLIYTSSSGTRFGKAEIMRGLSANTTDAPASTSEDEPPPTRYWAEDQQVMLIGDTAVVAFQLVGETAQQSGAEPDRNYYFNTGTFRKRDGIWQVIAWQATRIPDKPADQ